MFNVDRILEKSEYHEFIIESLHPDNKPISDYLFSNYKLHKSVNHKFCEIIYEEILGIINAAEYELKEIKKVSKSVNKSKSEQFAVLERKKVLIDLPTFPKAFYQQRMTSIKELNQEYKKFIQLVKDYSNINESRVKIKWNPKNKNHLYFILNKLKAIGLINNSIPELASFVKENIPAFSNKSVTSIRDAIQKGVEPKQGSIETVKIIKKIVE